MGDKKFTAKQIVAYYKKRNQIQKILKTYIRKNPVIVHGMQANNLNLPKVLNVKTTDYDVFGKNPSAIAKEIEKKLEKKFGNKDFFVVKQARHPTTIKIKSRITEKTIADITPKPRGVKPITKNGLKVVRISFSEKKAKQSLKNPKNKFRHKKDRSFLRRVRASKELKK